MYSFLDRDYTQFFELTEEHMLPSFDFVSGTDEIYFFIFLI